MYDTCVEYDPVMLSIRRVARTDGWVEGVESSKSNDDGARVRDTNKGFICIILCSPPDTNRFGKILRHEIPFTRLRTLMETLYRLARLVGVDGRDTILQLSTRVGSRMKYPCVCVSGNVWSLFPLLTFLAKRSIQHTFGRSTSASLGRRITS